MKTHVLRPAAALIALLAIVRAPLGAQDRLKTMPGYEQFQKISGQIPGSVKLAALTVQWKEDSSSFEYAWDGKRYRYDIAARQAVAARLPRRAARRSRRARCTVAARPSAARPS